MSNIDEIMKSGLDGKGLEYSDAHWASMEKLLSTKKPSFFARFKFYILIIGAVLLTGTLGYFLGTTTSENSQNNNQLATAVSSADLDAMNANNQHLIIQDGEETQPLALNNTQPSSNLIDLEANHNVRAEKPISRISLPVSDAQTAPLKFEDRASETPLLKTVKLRDFFIANLNPKWNVNFNRVLGHPSSAKNVPPLTPKTLYKPSFYIAPYYERSVYQKKIVNGPVPTLKQQELPVSSNGFGFDFGLRKNGFSIESGLAFTQLIEKTNYVSGVPAWNYDTTYSIVTKTYTTDPRGNNIALLTQQIDSTEAGTKDVVECPDCIANFKYIRVPLNVGYQLERGKLIYFGNAGASISFLRKSSGLYSSLNDRSLTPIYETVDLAQSDIANKQWVQASASVGLKYQLTSIFRLWSSYGRQWSVNSMMKEYTQKPQQSTIRIGLEFDL